MDAVFVPAKGLDMEVIMDIEKVLEQMTLEDKIALCSGASFWETKKYEKYGIPSLFMCDGPHGLRKQERENGADMLGVNESRPATCFPAEVTTAGSWDFRLTEAIGTAVGEEAREQGVGLVLGPGANLKRNPLCGRNFEYFSEDPYLAGKLAAGFIRGVEGQGVGSSLKHFAVNSQEKSRFNSDSILDGRTLRELYLTAFEIAVKEGKPSTVMCAYPKLNGVHCSDNEELLTDILREEWGFEGTVVTDWGAINDRVEGFRAGCDLNMPGGSSYMEKEVLRAVKEGTLQESSVDASARRVLKLAFRAERTLQEKRECDYDGHHALARRAAEQGAVLLKNEGGMLPLKENAKIAVIGAMAKKMRYQGAGSSHINPIKVSQPLLVRLHGDDSPPVRHMLFHMSCMGGPGHDDIAVIIPVVVSHLLRQPGVGIGVALNLNPIQKPWRDHHHIGPGTARALLFQDSDLAEPLLQKIEKRFPDVPVIQGPGLR